MTNALATFTTVNSNSRMTVSLGSISHVIEHTTPSQTLTRPTCWIHFDSGKSVHVNEDYQTVHEDIEEYLKTRQ